MTPRILIVDDHEVVREGIRTLISRSRPRWDICGEAANAHDAIGACRTLQPNVTVLDITMPGTSGLEVASSIAALGSRVLMFTMHESEHLAIEVHQAGAHGFVLKSQAGKDLIRAIERLLGGGTFFGSESDPHENEGEPPSPRRLVGQAGIESSFRPESVVLPRPSVAAQFGFSAM